jgi:hypothetical protein
LTKRNDPARAPSADRRESPIDLAPTTGHQLTGSEVLETSDAEGITRRAMHDVIHAPDDGRAQVLLAPGEEAAISFHRDPEAADAGADLAEDRGRSFLAGAVNGEDEGELEVPEGEAVEPGELADLADEENGSLAALEGDDEPTARPRVHPRRSRIL